MDDDDDYSVHTRRLGKAREDVLVGQEDTPFCPSSRPVSWASAVCTTQVVSLKSGRRRRPVQSHRLPAASSWAAVFSALLSLLPLGRDNGDGGHCLCRFLSHFCPNCDLLISACPVCVVVRLWRFSTFKFRQHFQARPPFPSLLFSTSAGNRTAERMGRPDGQQLWYILRTPTLVVCPSGHISSVV